MKILKSMKQNYEKLQIRGAIKEVMRNYGLRAISIKNYSDFIKSDEENKAIENIHSVKYDIMNGYIKMYQYKENDKKRRCGNALETVSNETYKEVYNIITKIINNDINIPSKIKRNIMVKINR